MQTNQTKKKKKTTFYNFPPPPNQIKILVISILMETTPNPEALNEKHDHVTLFSLKIAVKARQK